MTRPTPPPDRSLYERLGLTASLQSRRAAPSSRVLPRRPRPRGAWIVVPLLLAAMLVAWVAWPDGSYPARLASAAPDEIERRSDAQDAQIRALDRRVEMLEIKVEALEKIAGYPPAAAKHAPRPAN